MRIHHILRLRLRSLFQPSRVDEELREELEYHLSHQIDAEIARGLDPAAARHAARRALGSIEPQKEACRDARGLNFFDRLVQDVRFAIRQLAKNPGFTFTAILMLAVGLGTSMAVSGIVDAALIKPLPYPNPDRLLNVTEKTPQIPRANLSYPDYLDWKAQSTVFSSLDVHTGRSYMLGTSSGTEVVPGVRVSDGFFRTLGISPVLGRDFAPGEDLPSAPNTVILSYAAWQKRFGGSRDVIGQTVTLSGLPFTIIGVLPQGFQFAPRGRPELWTTLHASSGCDVRRGCHGLIGVARMKDGVSVAAARTEMETIARRLEQQYPDSNRDQGASVMLLSEVIVGDIRPVLLVLLGGAGLLLLIACVNVASLLLVRSESRRRELAVRSALGASHARLVRQFVTEAAVLVAIGTALGLFCASWAMHSLVGLVPADMMARLPFLDGAGSSPRVLACAAGVALVGMLLGLVCSIAGATLMRKVLFDTPPWDVPTLASVAAVLAVAALAASFVPARRAASVDPVVALRAE